MLKDLFFKITYPLAWGMGKRASILMYHSIGDNDAFFTVRTGSFEEQLKYIFARRMIVLKLSELTRRMRAGESIAGCVCMTFDDGYQDNYTNVFPLLKRYRIPATIFLATGSIGGTLTLKSGMTLPMLSHAQIEEMRQSGLVEFFPHSVTHVKYNGDNLAACAEEARASKRFFEERFKEPADTYAYPSGRFDAPLRAAIEHAGYTAAVTVAEGLVQNDDDLMALKRNAVDSLTTMPQFKGKLSRAIDWYTALKQLV